MKTNAKLYVMADAAGMVKLGHSRNPSKRSKQIGKGITLLHETDVLEQAERIERLAHRVLALHGRHLRGEWFEATLEQAIEAIEIAVKQAANEELSLGGKMEVPWKFLDDSFSLGLRVSRATRDGLKQIAKERGITTSQLAREALETFVRASDKGKARR